jgi:hypothetical protein
MIRICVLAAFLVALGSGPHGVVATLGMEADFLAKFKTAVAQKDFKAFSAMYADGGTVDPAMKDKVTKMSQDFFNTITSMSDPVYEFKAPSPTQPTSFEFEGKTYQPNLKIVDLLQVRDLKAASSVAAGTWGIPLGVDHGSLKVVQTVLKP